MSRSPRNLVIPLLASAVLLLAACGSGTSAGTAAAGQAAGGSAQNAGLPGEHVHGIARNPGDGKVYLATHHGLFRYDNGNPVLVGPEASDCLNATRRALGESAGVVPTM
jgi:hypothetical protein